MQSKRYLIFPLIDPLTSPVRSTLLRGAVPIKGFVDSVTPTSHPGGFTVTAAVSEHRSTPLINPLAVLLDSPRKTPVIVELNGEELSGDVAVATPVFEELNVTWLIVPLASLVEAAIVVADPWSTLKFWMLMVQDSGGAAAFTVTVPGPQVAPNHSTPF